MQFIISNKNLDQIIGLIYFTHNAMILKYQYAIVPMNLKEMRRPNV